MMKPSKSINRMTHFKSASRLYLNASGAVVAALVLMMTLSQAATNGPFVSALEAAAHGNSKASVSDRLPALTPLGSELVESTSVVKQQHNKQTIASAAASDLHGDQSNIANAKVHVAVEDMTPAAAGHYGKSHGGGGKYYMYAESPKKGAYKMGFKRGNHKHMIERKESSHKGHVSSYFKWHDKKGKGSHKFEFKHYDKKGKHYG